VKESPAKRSRIAGRRLVRGLLLEHDLSDLPTPAEASSHTGYRCHGFAQAGNRYPLFGIML